MICLICGKNYIALGVHVRHKHHVAPEDYREEFGLLKTAALADDSLRNQLRVGQLRAMQDPEYLAVAQTQCIANAASNSSRMSEMSPAGKELLATRNTQRNSAYLLGKAQAVSGILETQQTKLAVRRSLGMGTAAVNKLIALGEAPYSKEAAKTRRAENVAATVAKRRSDKVEAYIRLLPTAKTATEICRTLGITKTTHRRWLNAGVIPRNTK